MVDLWRAIRDEAALKGADDEELGKARCRHQKLASQLEAIRREDTPDKPLALARHLQERLACQSENN
ncbi:MAG: hypothetical protein SWN98_15810 [Pseudomonadota bacterium]|uniref:Uncharacterized protein n=1 Tax=Actibacterium naphthalenivorans TaxID=1614693 RepID=A0A840CF80_9RHOB|nr:MULTISPECIES: hypothetical protein [Actibacterium]MBB4022772.1 hypothetical protein [Actibacterium naphthalenivorans]MDY6860793.1 hypothetical protein [Pseudomonadota bacterium]